MLSPQWGGNKSVKSVKYIYPIEGQYCKGWFSVLLYAPCGLKKWLSSFSGGFLHRSIHISWLHYVIILFSQPQYIIEHVSLEVSDHDDWRFTQDCGYQRTDTRVPAAVITYLSKTCVTKKRHSNRHSWKQIFKSTVSLDLFGCGKHLASQW